jgi:hypothetical protein
MWPTLLTLQSLQNGYWQAELLNEATSTGTDSYAPEP